MSLVRAAGISPVPACARVQHPNGAWHFRVSIF